MTYLRATFRSIALCVVTALICALMISGMLVVFAFSDVQFRWRSLCFRRWARAVARIMNLKITVTGLAPSSVFFLVSNHLSYVDIVVFASLLDCVFVAKSDVARWPVIGSLCRSVNTIFIDRTRRSDVARVNRLIERSLARNRSVVLFAEGTSTDGRSIRPFKSSLLETAARAGFEVSYSAMSYSARAGELPARLAVCWWGDMTFMNHLFALLRLTEVRATVAFGSETIRESDRKALAKKLWTAVSNEFVPVVGLEEQCTARMR